MKNLQKRAACAFGGMGHNASGLWKNIYAFLLKDAGEVRGRSDAGNHELRKKIERFAKGMVPPEKVDSACEEFSVSPEAMELLARTLSKPPEEIPE